MNVISYTVTTPSKMRVTFNDKKVIVQGEVTFGPIPNTYIFYAYINSMSNWEYPKNEIITEDEKNEIIEYITKASKEDQTKIVFD